MNRYRYGSHLLFLGLFLGFSCNIDEGKKEKNITYIENSFNIEDDVLTFKSSEDLKMHVEGLKNDLNVDFIKNKLQKFYEKGFVPLAPQTDNLNFIEKKRLIFNLI